MKKIFIMICLSTLSFFAISGKCFAKSYEIELYVSDYESDSGNNGTSSLKVAKNEKEVTIYRTKNTVLNSSAFLDVVVTIDGKDKIEYENIYENPYDDVYYDDMVDGPHYTVEEKKYAKKCIDEIERIEKSLYIFSSNSKVYSIYKNISFEQDKDCNLRRFKSNYQISDIGCSKDKWRGYGKTNIFVKYIPESYDEDDFDEDEILYPLNEIKSNSVKFTFKKQKDDDLYSNVGLDFTYYEKGSKYFTLKIKNKTDYSLKFNASKKVLLTDPNDPRGAIELKYNGSKKDLIVKPDKSKVLYFNVKKGTLPKEKKELNNYILKFSVKYRNKDMIMKY